MKRFLISALLALCVTVSLKASVYHVNIKGNDEPRVIVTDESKNVSFVSDDDGTISMRFPLYSSNINEDIPIEEIESIEFNKPFIKIYPTEFYIPAEKSYLSIDIRFYPRLNTGYVPEFNIESESSEDCDVHRGGGSTYGELFGADIKENLTGSERVFKIPFKHLASGKEQIVTVYQSDKNLVVDDWKRYAEKWGNYYSIYVSSDEQTVEIPITLDDELESMWKSDWMRIEKEYKPFTYAFHIDENKGDARIHLFPLGGKAFNIDKYIEVEQLEAGRHSTEEHIAALRDFYNATGGPQWRCQENWFTDAPLHEWQGINNWGQDDELEHKFRINSFLTFYSTRSDGVFSNITGMLPPSFTVLMDDAKGIELNFTALKGKFPQELINHPRWNEFGWNFIGGVDPYYGGKIDYSDGINLRTDNKNQWDAVNQDWFEVYDVLAEHDYTLVVNAPYAPWIDPEAGDIPLAQEYVNLWLDYASKGLGIVTSQAFPNVSDIMGVNIYLDLVEPELLNRIEKCRYPEEIRWFDNFASVGPLGTPAIYDRQGNLIWACPRNYLIKPKYFADEAAAILKGIYGDPVAHEPFIIEKYTSTDFSEDGKVIELQKATVGKGIDIVLMGDGFLDRDMAQDGMYEVQMRDAMEYLFMVEPMASLRDRFNVYAVKVVSTNDFTFSDAEHALNRDEDAVRRYAEKIDGLDFGKAHTVVIENTGSIMMSGYTLMLPESGSLAIITSGGASEILIHEAVGHGIGKLLDEYIEPGFEHAVVGDDQKDVVKQWLKTNYHDLGYGMNISSSPVPEETPWAHMLADEDYSKEVSVVKGAWYYPNDLWRPTENSCMRYDYQNFNAPSREAIYKWVMQCSEGPDWKYDFQTFKNFDKALQSKNNAVTDVKTKINGKRTQKKFHINNLDKIKSTAPVLIHRAGKVEKY